MPARPRHDCPICGREAPPRGGVPAGDGELTRGQPAVPPPGPPGNPSFPFCSPACKLIDLGRWLDGEYRLPGPPIESTLEIDGEAGDRHTRDDE